MVKFFCLFLLYRGPKHGYRLIKEIEKNTGSRPSASQIYPFLDKLEENGLIEVKKRGKRGKKIYSLTEKGLRFVEKRLEMFGDILSVVIEKNVNKCAHCGCEVYKGGYQEEVNGERLMFCCKHCARTYKKD